MSPLAAGLFALAVGAVAWAWWAVACRRYPERCLFPNVRHGRVKCLKPCTPIRPLPCWVNP